VCVLAAPLVQLSVSAGNGWPHNALRHHWLMPISCYFPDCKELVRQPGGKPCTGGPTTGFCRLCTYEPSLSGIRVVPSWHYWAFWENGPFPWQPSPKYEKL